MNSANTHNKVLYTLLWIVFCLHLIWLLNDQTVWPWDQAWYAEVSLHLHSQFESSWFSWLTDLRSAFGFKAPGIAWVGQFFLPLRHLFGSIEPSLLLLCVASSIFSALAISYTTESIFPTNRLAPITAALAVLTAPLCVGMSHQYFVEALQLFIISIAVLLCLKPISWMTLALLPGLIALGLLTKITTPAYMLLPGSIFLWKIFKEPLKQNKNLFKLNTGQMGPRDFMNLVFDFDTEALRIAPSAPFGFNVKVSGGLKQNE